MGTKWRNKLKFVMVLILLTYGLSGVIAGLLNGNRYLVKTYFQSYEFEDQVNHFANLLSMFELNDMTEEEAKKAITVSADEIEEHRYRYGSLSDQIMNIESQYEGQIQSAKDEGNKTAEKIYTEERNEKIEDITKNFKDDEYVRAKIMKEKESQLDEFYNQLKYSRSEFESDKKLFVYYFKDIETDKVYTNLNLADGENPKKYINNKDMYYIKNYPVSGAGYLTSTDGILLFSEGNEFEVFPQMKEAKFAGQIGLPKSAPEDSIIMNNYHEFDFGQKVYYSHTISGIIVLFTSIFLFRRNHIFHELAESKWAHVYNRVPLELRMIMILFTFMAALFSLFESIDYYPYRHYYEFAYTFILLAVSAFFTCLFIIQSVPFFSRMKNSEMIQTDLRKSLINRSLKAISGVFLIQKMGIQLMILLSIVFLFGAGAAGILVEPGLILIYFPFMLIIGIPVLMYILKKITYFNQIVANTNDIMLGNLEDDLPVHGKTVLGGLSANINALKHGVKTSQQKQVKSERLKTELITNVSHDLRTPLTSIISYTELLKKHDLSKDERDSYIQIIDRKSQQLKILIDDLFEASKMASGNIEFVKEKVDLTQLLQQALAEYNEAISKSTLQFRAANPDHPVYAVVDGQKMWRVFENLIGNILKYSMENTRVYLSMKQNGEQVIISFKNVSKYELSENTDELFERFKRGDSSRHTEGSGLGLTIAKSIVDLHGGRMEIEVDGDLFKVTITLEAN
ncbi:GHKL domain-containing protein [Bacillus sp. PAMC26568]|nr:GHKL domain-containing protein [Bacillus sp. PAMC26568]